MLSSQNKRIERKWWVLIAIGISTFMSGLDTSVVNTVLPVVNSSFDSDSSPAILTKSSPDNQRGQTLGMQATMTYLGFSGAIFTTVLAQQVETTAGLYSAIQAAFLAAIGVALLGALTSAIRGERQSWEEKHAALST